VENAGERLAITIQSKSLPTKITEPKSGVFPRQLPAVFCENERKFTAAKFYKQKCLRFNNNMHG
jgi:hypothetical protein